jgi:hypothetical protein
MNQSYAEREPVAYFDRLKELHHELRTAYARGEDHRVMTLKWEIRSFRLLSNSVWGKGTG